MKDLRRWNSLMALIGVLITTGLGLATQPLAAQTTTAAVRAYRSGDFQQAAGILAGIPDKGLLVDADALVVRGFARYQTGALQDAARDFRQVLDRSPRYADAWYGLALIARAQGNADQALTLARQAATLDPARPDVQTLLAALEPQSLQASREH
ncbi:hypothetical protein GCM10008959_40720 [Deinococcus seoulensis]|uniref:Tetratricopeptide repeat protein n=1 Tax=Deinococcus seoulensis TaxID=1837379 RepID=A0ABQ2S0B2_9DEIO|nr:tetratricopeptide repeat protein [Deinococcus seoulensis]GGR75508.1 hypothetical protein GCM10008959_40720 [Deinococcus seoulensis]